MEPKIKHYKIAIFVPGEFKERVKQAMFEHGAGRYDAYDYCSWEILGVGQFRPLDNSQPYLGQQGQLERVEEYRVEMICTTDEIKLVLEAMLEQHPYEVPAYEVWPIYSVEDF